MPRASKPSVCGALVQNQPYGRTDVCGLEAGHEKMLNPEPFHIGRYRGMKWETYRDPKTGKKRNNIIDQGRSFEEERLEGGTPVPPRVQRHLIDRARPGGHVPPPPGGRTP